MSPRAPPAGEGVVRTTLRALLGPRRLVPILLVCVPLVALQARGSADRLAVPLAVAMCGVFVLAAPLSWRTLFPEEGPPVPPSVTLLRLFLYVATGTGVVLALGAALPRLTGMGRTFLTTRDSLLACWALYLAGGWGLGRDVAHEHSLGRAQARAAALAQEVERTHLLALRSHLDPHFLFNSLNAIAEWCREDGRVAERAVLQLSTMLRAILEGVRAPTWPLERELELVHHLFEMYLLRDPALFCLELDVAPGLGAVPVPPMVLLPLAENAMKHGPAAGHRGRVRLALVQRGGELLVTLENPGPYRGPRPGSEGLPTLQRRLALAYGGRARLLVGACGDAGTAAELTLPLSGPSGELAA